jgi:hypothetical protein
MYHWHRIDAATDDSARRAPGTATSTAPCNTAPRGSETRPSETRDGDAHRAGAYRGTRAHRRTPAPRGAASQHPNGTGSGPGGPAVQAVQVALDRRDNGGDLAASRDE